MDAEAPWRRYRVDEPGKRRAKSNCRWRVRDDDVARPEGRAITVTLYSTPLMDLSESPSPAPERPMARIARFVVPGLPHHVTQRGNRRERVFFADEDYELYRDLLSGQCRKQGVAVWAYCLMPGPSHPGPRPRGGVGRPPGSTAFLDRLGVATRRDPRPRRRGPKPRRAIGD
jgi:hypothetical protein